jgi:hypothetical protein
MLPMMPDQASVDRDTSKWRTSSQRSPRGVADGTFKSASHPMTPYKGPHANPSTEPPSVLTLTGKCSHAPIVCPCHRSRPSRHFIEISRCQLVGCVTMPATIVSLREPGDSRSRGGAQAASDDVPFYTHAHEPAVCSLALARPRLAQQLGGRACHRSGVGGVHCC